MTTRNERFPRNPVLGRSPWAGIGLVIAAGKTELSLTYSLRGFRCPPNEVH